MAKHSLSINIPESTLCPDLYSISLTWIVTAVQGILPCFSWLTLDSSFSVLELGFQTVSAKVIPGQERTNWEQLLSNETITPNKSENRVFPAKKKFLNRLTSKKNQTVNQPLWSSVGCSDHRNSLSSSNVRYLHICKFVKINFSLALILTVSDIT